MQLAMTFHRLAGVGEVSILCKRQETAQRHQERRIPRDRRKLLWHMCIRVAFHKIGRRHHRMPGRQCFAGVECLRCSFHRFMGKTFRFVSTPVLSLALFAAIPYRLTSSAAFVLCNLRLDFAATFMTTDPSNTGLDFGILLGPIPNFGLHPKILSKPEVVLSILWSIHWPGVHVEVAWGFESCQYLHKDYRIQLCCHPEILA